MFKKKSLKTIGIYWGSIYGAPPLFQFQFMGSQAYSRHGIAGHGSSWGRGGWAGGLLGTGLLLRVFLLPCGRGLLGPLGASCYFSAAPQVYRRYSPKASLPEDHQSIITSSLNVSSEHIRKFQTLGEKYIGAPGGGMAYKEKTVLSIPHECLDTPAQACADERT